MVPPATPPQILIVTSAGAAPSAVVPVLAAIEAAGMRVRAIDVGAVGGAGAGVADRVRRVLLGEAVERRLRKELELSPPDAAIAFDPFAAHALTIAREQVPAVAGLAVPVLGVVGELDPAAAWAHADCDRYLAIDDLAAVALADAGVDGERVLVVGAVGERAFAEAGATDRAALRTRFKLSGKVALVEVGGLGAEPTGQLALQLSLLEGSDQLTFLFDAGLDVEAAAVLRRQVPALGLRGKLFGATADAPLLWRAADVIVARPRAEVIARVLLLGAKLVALLDDADAAGVRAAAALEARKRAVSARGLLLLASALEAAFGGVAPPPTPDGAEHVGDIAFAVGVDKRGVIDERRATAQAATRDRVRAASAAAQAAAATTAMPGELEDLGGAPDADAAASAFDDAEIARLRTEVQQRKGELTAGMMAARDAATRLGEQSKVATARGATDEASQLDRRADAERARMHAILGELATLEQELAELERIGRTVRDVPPPRATAGGAPRGSSGSSGSGAASAPPRPGPRPASLDDALADLKRRAGGAPPGPRAEPAPSTGAGRPARGGASTVDDELAALKRKMSSPPPKSKP